MSPSVFAFNGCCDDIKTSVNVGILECEEICGFPMDFPPKAGSSLFYSVRAAVTNYHTLGRKGGL